MTVIASLAAAGELPAASGSATTAWWLVALPLLGSAILLLGGRALDKIGPALATGLSWGSFGVGCGIFFGMLAQPADQRASDLRLFDWISAGPLHLAAGMRVDPLSIAFVLLVTFVGSLIHVYSLGYMAHDPDKRRFFAYLNFFVASMLLLVLADSYLLLFVGWEGVGLASWLLIGFWNHNPAYATAANKAFVANRVGDFGLLIAMFLMLAHFGRLDFAGVNAAVEGLPGSEQGFVIAIGLFLLLGACGKSAQFPLQSWLGDAMAGPTPVSALIHAATMVTAGVYLVVRSGAIYHAAPTAQLVVVIVGCITLVFGAIVGCAKDDIKKALAASTMSQIGYMMLAAGLGPLGAVFAIFHLITHGFFKAGMFLGAGSVMHGMNDAVDMRRFGGLSGKMKITWATFLFGWLAIIGFPGFSGFWSKDKIIEEAFVGEGWRPWVFGLAAMLAAGLTAFYMSRLFFMTFHGRKRWPAEAHPHESPATMTIPMVVLAIGSAFLGLILGPTGFFQHWLEPVVGTHEGEAVPVMDARLIMGLTFALVIAGVAFAWARYWRDDVSVIAPSGNVLTEAARRDLYQDTVNEALLMYPGIALTRGTVAFDQGAVDHTAMGVGRFVRGTGGVLRRLQNGFARSYAMTMLAGVVVLLAVVWVIQ